MLIIKLFCATAVPILLACTQSAAAERTARMSVEQSEAARTALVEWFECEECEEGQLQAVVKYGQAVVPLLRSALLHGASPASREILRRELEKRYDELQKYQQTHRNVKISSKEQFIASNIDNLNAQYQVRAAQALAEIGGPTAIRALEDGLDKAKRADVRTTIKNSLSKLKK